MSETTTSTEWMDEPIGSFPWNVGELMELPHGPHLYYLRVVRVDDKGVALQTKLLGGVTDGNLEYNVPVEK